MRLFKTLILLLLGITAGFSILAQQAKTDWKTLSPDAYETGVLYLKLSPQAFQLLPGGEIPNSPDGFRSMPELQKIWQEFGFASFRKLVDIPLKPAKFGLSPLETDVLRWVSIRLTNGKALLPALEALNACKPWVEMAEPVYRVEIYDDKPFFEAQWFPNDSLFSRQWHYHNTGQSGGTEDADIDLPEAWDIERGHPSVVVAVMDNGIDTTHADLRQNLSSLRGFNFFSNQPDLVPGNHGNHTSGTIGAVNNNNLTWVSGIAGGDGSPGSGARLLSCQIFGVPSGSGGIENAFVWSAQQGAAISNNSWGYVNPNVYNQSALDAIDFFIENGGGSVIRKGLVIFSGGNGGDYTLRWPGTYHKVIGVAATNHHDRKTWYSTYHERLDIAAPGGELNTTSGGPLVNSGRGGVLSTIVQASGGVGYLQGTSMAAPHVTGVAALVASQGRGRLSADDIKSILLTQVDDINLLQEENFRNRIGTGRLNAFKALDRTRQLMQVPAVGAPGQLTATVACRHVQLSWTKSAPGDEVMVAVSREANRGGLFGIPSGTYAVGDTLLGGGRIIYKGPANGYTYTQTEVGGSYYFKIWTVSAAGHYSFGVVPSNPAIIGSSIVSFSAVVNCYDHTDLSWQFGTGCANTPVLVAFNTVNIFENPSGTYNPGDSLGSAVVLFSGSGQSFRHILPPVLDSTRLYYQIWPYLGNGIYGPPLLAQTYTPAALERAYAKSFTSTSVRLGWDRDTCFDGDVLVVWNLTGQFSQPAGILLAGDILAGGDGTVLYKGPADETVHEGLQPNTTYHYGVWPIINGQYGWPRFFSVKTRCSNEVVNLPFRDTIGPESLNGCLLDTVSFRNFTAGPWPQLKVVENGINPQAAPFAGRYMLAFNSYDSRERNEVWLTSPPLNSRGIASVDVAFKWFEDGSDFNTDFFNTEGISLLWSNDYINWKSVIEYPRIPQYGGDGWKYKQVTLPPEAANRDALYVRWVFTSAWGYNCYLDEVAVIPTTPLSADGNFHKAVAEFDVGFAQIHYYDAEEKLLLSLNGNNADFGHVDEGMDIGVGGQQGSVKLPATGNYVRNTGGWASLGKYWHIADWNAPSAPVKLRQFISDAELQSLKTMVASSFTPPIPTTDSLPLMAHLMKRTGRAQSNPSKGHGGISIASSYGLDGFWQFDRSTLVDTLRFTMSPFIPGWHIIEYPILEHGGGSVGVGSPAGNGALAPHWISITGVRQQKTTLLTWTTGYEREWLIMQVERASGVNGIFSEIGLVSPGGWSQTGATYNFTDRQLLPNGGYRYRVRATDLHGKEFLSPEVGLAVNDIKNLLLFPNPARGGSVTIFSEQSMNWIRVVDALGRTVYTAKPLASQFRLELPQLATGIYFVQAGMEMGTRVQRLWITR